MITINNIHKRFTGNDVLRGVDLTINEGETLAIIGRSGCGKSVLLKHIVGLLFPDDGYVTIENKRLDQTTPAELYSIRRRFGFLFQGAALFDSMTVEQNVLFPLNMFSDMNESQKMERVNFCLNRVNIKDANHLFPAEISGGMQKRVAIARAISLNPKYLFCDEPNSGLDPETATVIDKLILELTKEFQMTTIINTHDMNSVIEIGESVLFISKGEKEWVGTRNEILTSNNKKLNDFIFANKLYAQMKNGK